MHFFRTLCTEMVFETKSSFVKSAFGLLIGLSIFGFADAQQQLTGDGPRKMLTEFEHDFGTLAKNEFAEHRFEIKNVFNEDIRIQQVKTSCACTDVTLLKNYLKKGESTELVAVFNTQRFVGQKQATVTLILAPPYSGEVQLTVRGNIRSDVMFEPGSIDFGSVTQQSIANKTARRVSITKFNNPNWQIIDVKSTFSDVGVTLSKPVRFGNQVKYDMDIRIKESAPAGYVQGELIIVAQEFGRNSEIPIKFSAKVASALQISPDILTISTAESGAVIEKKVVIKADKPFKINDVKCINQSFSVEADPEKSRKVHFVNVSYSADQPPGRYEYDLEIITDLNSETTGSIKAVVEIEAASVTAGK